jgi:hypothetical protein
VESGRRLRIRRQPDCSQRERAEGGNQRRESAAHKDPETRQRERQHERLSDSEKRHEAATAQGHREHQCTERDRHLRIRRASQLAIDHHEQRRGDEESDPVRVEPRSQPAGLERRRPLSHPVDW